MADGAWCFAWRAVHDGYFFGNTVGQLLSIREVGRSTYVLSRFPVPHGQEDALQIAHGISFKMYVHIVPFTDFRQSVDVVVGNVHAAGITYLSVNHYYFPMVAVYGMVYPGKSDRVELDDFDALGMDGFQMVFLQWLVVGPVAEGIEHGADFNSLLDFLCQKAEQGIGYGVVAEVEVFQMDMMPGMADILEEIDELVMAGHQQFHFIVISDGGAHFLQVIHDNGIACCLRPGIPNRKNE